MMPTVDQKLTVLTLGVRDLARSRAFYTDSLGWTPTLDIEDEVVFYQVGHGLLLALFGLDDLGNDAGHPATPGTPFSLGHNVDSEDAVDAATERARAAGATILKEPQRASFGGYHAYVADPDGHRWEIVYAPGIAIGDDGTVRFGAPS
jgi:catechol 2,3-dioxygenase-like lactoylglutathione lyase family enzyme